MNILIPAKGTSKRIPKKNMQPLGNRPLVGWVIYKAVNWFPDSRVFVATEDEETRIYALECGCEIYDLTEDDLCDRRDATDLQNEFGEKFSDRPLVLLQPTSPFTFRSEITAALSMNARVVASAWNGKLHLLEFGHALSQTLPSLYVATGNFFIANTEGTPGRDEWKVRSNLCPVNCISAIDINTDEDLKTARWLAEFVSPEDFDYSATALTKANQKA